MTETAAANTGLTVGDDGQLRCFWQGGLPDYVRYHDDEWGMPVADDRALYEKLCLEGFQAGLSWITVLRKRAAFRELFEGFEIERVARFTEADIDRITSDARIIRHRGKVAATVNNARAVIALREKQSASFAHFLWQYEPDAASRPAKLTLQWLRANPISASSTELSKVLRKNGFNFVGPTTCYAFMQSMGFVNDHIEGCACRSSCETARLNFTRP